jgi:hypothetical protein
VEPLAAALPVVGELDVPRMTVSPITAHTSAAATIQVVFLENHRLWRGLVGSKSFMMRSFR